MDHAAALPFASHALYRLFRLRRQIAVTGTLPLLGAVPAGLLVAPGSFFASPEWIFGLTAAWTCVMAALAVRFPGGWLEAVGFSITMALIAAAAPWTCAALAHMISSGAIVGFVVVLGATSFGILFLAMGLVLVVIWALSGRPAGERRARLRLKVPLPIEEARSRLFLYPDAQSDIRRTGFAGADGFFEVFFKIEAPDPCTSEMVVTEHSFHAKILEETDTEQTVLYSAEQEDGSVTTSVEVQTLIRDGDKTLSVSEEVHDHFDWCALVGWWLTDAGGDAMTERYDEVMENPQRALKRMPQESPLTWLAARVGSGGAPV